MFIFAIMTRGDFVSFPTPFVVLELDFRATKPFPDPKLVLKY